MTTRKGGEGIVASLGDELQPIKFRQIDLLFTVPYLCLAAKHGGIFNKK